jgi:hypothetical protein
LNECLEEERQRGKEAIEKAVEVQHGRLIGIQLLYLKKYKESFGVLNELTSRRKAFARNVEVLLVFFR